MSAPSSPTHNPAQMALDPTAPPQHAAAMQQDPVGSQPQAPPSAPYQVPQQYPATGPSHAPLHPMAQGGFPHAYSSPYGAPLPYSASLASSSMTVPHPTNTASFLPPGMPPLMPIPGMSWEPVANHHLLVAHVAGCPCCTDFVRHYQGAMNDTSFRDTRTSVQTQLQAQFWAYFEEHARSREGESRNEHARQVEELEWQLRAALDEASALRDRARINSELEQQLNAARTEATTLCQDRDRYRSERNQAREMLSDENRLRARASQTRPNQARRVPAVPPGHPDFPESPERAYPVRPVRSTQEDSPRRLSTRLPALTEPGPSRDWDEPMLMAGPSQTGPSGSSSAQRAGGSSRTTRVASNPTQSPSSPEPLGSSSRHPATGRGPTVDFQDFEELSSGEEAELFDEKYINKKTERRKRQHAVRGDPLPAPPRPASYSRDGHSPRPIIQGWPYHLLPVPKDSDPREADHWYDFVPVTADDAQRLLQATATDMSQARSRIKHLLKQVQANSSLQGVQGLRVLADTWRNPDKKPYLPTIMHPAAYTPPGMEFADTLHLPPPMGRRPGAPTTLSKPLCPVQDLNGPRRQQPRTIDPPEVHREWWWLYQDCIPQWMERDQDGGPTLAAARLFVYTRQPIARSRTIPERARWVVMVNVLFSAPGLYRHILNQWQLQPQGPYVNAYYTGLLEDDDLTVFHVAHWYATRGLTVAAADLLQRSAHRVHAQQEGMDHNINILPFRGITSILSVGPVPPMTALSLHGLAVNPALAFLPAAPATAPVPPTTTAAPPANMPAPAPAMVPAPAPAPAPTPPAAPVHMDIDHTHPPVDNTDNTVARRETGTEAAAPGDENPPEHMDEES